MKLNKVVVKRKLSQDSFRFTDKEAFYYYLKKISFNEQAENKIIMIGVSHKLNLITTNIMTLPTFQKNYKEILSNYILSDTINLLIADNFINQEDSLEAANIIKNYCKSLDYKILDYYNTANNVHFEDIITHPHILDNLEEDNTTLDLDSQYIKTNYYLELENSKSIARNDVYSALNTICSEMKDLDREHLYQLNLNEKLEPINYAVLSIGDISSSIVSIKNNLATSMLSKATHSIILHNHPSGDTTPSQSDDAVTKKLINAYNSIGINLLDHVIVGDKNYSYRKNGKLKHLQSENISEIDNYSAKKNYIDSKINIELGETLKTNKGDAIVIALKNNNNAILLQPNKPNCYIAAKGIYYDEQKNIYGWNSGEYCDNMLQADLYINNEFDDIKMTMESISTKNHSNFVKALMFIESGMEDEEVLDNIYDEYMLDDTITLLDDNINRQLATHNELEGR